jgi:hypothetical protein
VLGGESATQVVDDDDNGAEPDEHLSRRLADAEPTTTLEAAARCNCMADRPYKISSSPPTASASEAGRATC